MRYLTQWILLLMLALLTGCTDIVAQQTGPVFPGARWGIATFANNTETPQAGSRATSITAVLLRGRGINYLTVYQPYGNCSQFTLCPNSAIPLPRILSWAKQNNIRYVMTGAVNEWQYKVGLDGEPVAAVSMQLYDAYTGRVVWSGVGSKIGCSRAGLGNTAQRLIDQMLGSLGVHP